MKENELRVGNWFYHNPLDWSYRNCETNPSVGDFNGYCFQWNSSDWYALSECTLFLKSISPIPLTEELLLKCGYKKYNGYGYRFAQGYLVKHENGFFYHYHGLRIRVDHLHQLQNLVFALTNEELPINL